MVRYIHVLLIFVGVVLTTSIQTFASSKVWDSMSIVDTLFYESFNTNGGTGGNDSSWSGQIANTSICSDNDGWEFSSGHAACNCVRLGLPSEQGIAVTPKIDLSDALTDTLLLTFYAGAWNTTSEKTSLSITASQGSLSPQVVTLKKGAFTKYTLKFVPSTYPTTRITFRGSSTNGRFFLDAVLLLRQKSILVGDANSDGKISISDVPSAIAIWHKESRTAIETSLADVDGVNGVNAADIEILVDTLLDKSK